MCGLVKSSVLNGVVENELESVVRMATSLHILEMERNMELIQLQKKDRHTGRCTSEGLYVNPDAVAAVNCLKTTDDYDVEIVLISGDKYCVMGSTEKIIEKIVGKPRTDLPLISQRD